MRHPLRRAGRDGPPSDAAPLVRLWRYAHGHRRTVVAAISFSVLNKLADVVPELLIGAAVDVVVRAEDSLVATVFGVEDRFDQLLVLAAINVVVWLVESGTEFISNLLWRNLAQTIEHEARMDAYRHVQRLELAWFEDQSTGGLLSILNDDVNQLERFLDVGANELIRTLVNVVFVGAVFFAAAPVLGVVAFLPIPVIVWASIRYQRRLEPRYTEVRQAAGDLGALLANNVSAIAPIRSFTAEDRESDRVAAASGLYREANRRAIHLSSAFIPLIRMAILAAFTLTLLIGGQAALNGSLEVGVFSVLVYMTQRLLWPLTRLGETFDLYQRAMASTRRILDLLAVDPTIVAGPRALPPPVRGEVRFDGVRFAYGGAAAGGDGDAGGGGRRVPARLVLDGFDLVVPRGETHAIVGSTGAGCPTATTRWSASAARSCRAGNASGCRSRGRSSRILRCWCSTRPPRPSTTRPRRRSSVLSSWSAGTGPSSPPPPASRPCVTPTASTCSRRGGSWSPATTTSSSPAAASTPPSGASRPGKCTRCPRCPRPTMPPPGRPAARKPRSRLRAVAKAERVGEQWGPGSHAPLGGPAARPGGAEGGP